MNHKEGSNQMLKRLRLIAMALLTLVVGFAGLLRPPSSSSQRTAQTTTTASRNAALIAATNDVLKETSDIRQLAILRPVKSSTQSRSEIERMIMKNIDEETTPGQMHAAEVTMKRLGLAPADFQYRALTVRVLTEQVAGYYEPKTGEFHLADWIDLDGQRPVMAHELTHALQDQHFNLRRFDHWPKGDSDAELATHALIEGDATLAMALYVANNPLRALLFLKSIGTSSIASQELDKAPRAIRETLLFPYQQGIDWTKNLYKQSGWDSVSKAFTALPQSTEQILHSDKYFAHEAPAKVTLPDITSLLNGGSQSSEVRGRRSEVRGRRSEVRSRRSEVRNQGLEISGRVRREVVAGLRKAHAQDARATWKRLDYDVQGEWGFYLILDEFLKSPAESRRAAAGWGGDRFAVYEGPKGQVLFASLSTWDTENDAREFFDAYVKRTELRYPGAIVRDPIPQTQSPTAAKAFRTLEGSVVIELHGNRVAIVEGLPDRVDGSAVLKALWQ
jgi:hypothetical protein